jgi:hypothetical protein
MQVHIGFVVDKVGMGQVSLPPSEPLINAPHPSIGDAMYSSHLTEF